LSTDSTLLHPSKNYKYVMWSRKSFIWLSDVYNRKESCLLVIPFFAFMSLYGAGTKGAKFILCARAHSFGVGSLRGELIELASHHRDDCRRTLWHQQHWVPWMSLDTIASYQVRRQLRYYCPCNRLLSLFLLKRDVIASCYAGLSLCFWTSAVLFARWCT
jgi:hypothetical protein